MYAVGSLTAEAMGRRRRSAWPLALSLVLFFIAEVESFHAKNSACMPEQSLLKAQKPPGGNGASAGGGSDESGGNPRGSSSSPYGKVIPIVGGAERNSHHKGHAYCFSCCNHHFPVVFSITLLSAVVLVYG